MNNADMLKLAAMSFSVPRSNMAAPRTVNNGSAVPMPAWKPSVPLPVPPPQQVARPSAPPQPTTWKPTVGQPTGGTPTDPSYFSFFKPHIPTSFQDWYGRARVGIGYPIPPYYEGK